MEIISMLEASGSHHIVDTIHDLVFDNKTQFDFLNEFIKDVISYVPYEQYDEKVDYKHILDIIEHIRIEYGRRSNKTIVRLLVLDRDKGVNWKVFRPTSEELFSFIFKDYRMYITEYNRLSIYYSIERFRVYIKCHKPISSLLPQILYDIWKNVKIYTGDIYFKPFFTREVREDDFDSDETEFEYEENDDDEHLINSENEKEHYHGLGQKGSIKKEKKKYSSIVYDKWDKSGRKFYDPVKITDLTFKKFKKQIPKICDPYDENDVYDDYYDTVGLTNKEEIIDAINSESKFELMFIIKTDKDGKQYAGLVK